MDKAPERIWRNKRGNATGYTAKPGLIEYTRTDIAEAENARLREDLIEYSEHRIGCRRRHAQATDDKIPCTCGLEAAIKGE